MKFKLHGAPRTGTIKFTQILTPGNVFFGESWKKAK